MKRIYRDQEKKVHIKVAGSPEKAWREVVGARILSRFAVVPEVELIDTQTLQITSFAGLPAGGAPKMTLNGLLGEYFLAVKEGPILEPSGVLSLIEEVELLRTFFPGRGVRDFLAALAGELEVTVLYPVHGDLQKQNIFVGEKGLGLIDFEHFVFAPLELDLVNSVFFRDQNCLDVDFLIPKLVEMGLFDPALIEKMFMIYALEELRDGRGLTDVNRRIIRGRGILERLLGRKCDSVFPVEKMVRSNYSVGSTVCFV